MKKILLVFATFGILTACSPKTPVGDFFNPYIEEGTVYSSGYHYIEDNNLDNFLIQIPFENTTVLSLSDLEDLKFKNSNGVIDYEFTLELESVANPFNKNRYILKIYLTGEATTITSLTFSVGTKKYNFPLDIRFFVNPSGKYIKDQGVLELTSFDIAKKSKYQYDYNIEYKFTYSQYSYDLFLKGMNNDYINGLFYNSIIRVYDDNYRLISTHAGAPMDSELSNYYYIRILASNNFLGYFSNENIAFEVDGYSQPASSDSDYMNPTILKVQGEASAYRSILEKQENLYKGLN